MGKELTIGFVVFKVDNVTKLTLLQKISQVTEGVTKLDKSNLMDSALNTKAVAKTDHFRNKRY